MSEKPEQPDLRVTTRWNILFKYLYLLVTVAGGLILVPFYIRFIPIELYGAWLATGNVLAWLSAIDPGLAGVLQQRVGAAYGEKNASKVAGYIFSGLVLVAILSTALVILALVVGPFVSDIVGLESEGRDTLARAFVLAAVGSALTIGKYVISGANYGLQGTLGMGIRSVTVALIGFATTLGLLFAGWGLYAIAVGIVVRAGFNVLWSLIYLFWRLGREKIPIRADFSRMRELLSLIQFTFLGRIGGIFSKSLQKIIVARFLGVNVVPMLDFTKKAPSMSRMVIEQLPVALMPAISHLKGQGKIRAVRRAVLRLFRITIWTVALMLGGFITYNESFVTLWVGEEFFAGHLINLVIIGAVIAQIYTSLLSNVCMALGNIRGNGLNIFIQGVLNVIFLLVGTWALGLLGAVLAPLLSLSIISLSYFVRKLHELTEMRRADWTALLPELFKTLSVVAVLSFIGWQWPPNTWPLFILCVVGYSVVYGVWMGVWSPLMRRELQHARGLIVTKLRRTFRH